MKIVVKLPAEAIPNVIGPNGSIIKQLQGISETKIKIKNEDHNHALCYINGQKENAELAEKLISDIIANKSPLTKGRKDSDVSENDNDSRYEKFSDTNDMIQVYVSSIASPTHFWLQLITPKACALEHLVDDMTGFYSVEENKKQYALAKVTIGQIVATKLPTDEKWCRAEVCGVRGRLKDQNPEMIIDLFCVDYGDSSYHSLKNIYKLKPDFLSLRFQAIEVTMCDILPKNGHDWSEESRTAFENMVFTGEWKVMLAQVVDLKRKVRTGRKGFPLPCVRLYDPEGSQTLDISQKLVKMGFALADLNSAPLKGSASALPTVKTEAAAVTTNTDKKEIRKKKGNVTIKPGRSVNKDENIGKKKDCKDIKKENEVNLQKKYNDKKIEPTSTTNKPKKGEI